MRDLYNTPSAERPKLATDRLFTDPRNRYRFDGAIHDATAFIERQQLLNPVTWARFVQQFRSYTDSLAESWQGLAWRCEYWGKMMRGACFTYAYTRNPALYATVEGSVRDMLSVHRERGRLSTYSPERAYDGWDLWGRKYVLLGMEYFYEICEDAALRADILDSLCRQADDILSAIGEEADGKRPINMATRHWRGLNSSSILEPFVRLYTLTGKTEYFDFATYIVKEGGTEVVNIFELAYRNKLYPYQYPMTKAYEMISCFEGLLEYYRVTGIEKYKLSVIRFAERVLESDFTVIGCSGCTHELFDHSTVRQANTNNGRIQQETCVTVTLMKFMYQLTSLTGEPKYVDAFEASLYNAYLGAVNTEGRIEPTLTQMWEESDVPREATEFFAEALPFDSYSPLTAGMRGGGIGGLQFMSDGHYYGCCACIGSAGFGLVPKLTLMSAEDGFALNLYFNGTADSTAPDGTCVRFTTETAYPADGNVKITLHLKAQTHFTLRLRIPAWSEHTAACVCGERVEAYAGSYLSLTRTWHEGDTVTLSFDMTTRAHRPLPYGHQILMNEVIWEKQYVIPTYDEEDPLAKHHVALTRGPLVLAQESRLGYSPDIPHAIRIAEDGTVAVRRPSEDTAPYPHLIELCVPLEDGSEMTVTDYASAGKTFSNESRMAAWMRVT